MNFMKRRILLISLFLFIGSVLNIAIAKYCAIANSTSIRTLNTIYPSAMVQSVGFGPIGYSHGPDFGFDVWPEYINRSEDLTLHHRMQRDEENKSYWLDEDENRIYSGNVGHGLFVPLYNKLHAQGNGAQMELRFRAGTPFRILTGKIDYVPLPGNPSPLWKNTVYDLKVTTWRYGADPGARFVPTLYMWSGLIAGTGFWGMAFALGLYSKTCS